MLSSKNKGWAGNLNRAADWDNDPPPVVHNKCCWWTFEFKVIPLLRKNRKYLDSKLLLSLLCTCTVQQKSKPSLISSLLSLFFGGFFLTLWSISHFVCWQEWFSERGKDPVTPEGSEHHPPAGSVCEQRSTLYGHWVHGMWGLEPISVAPSASRQDGAFSQCSNYQVKWD